MEQIDTGTFAIEAEQANGAKEFPDGVVINKQKHPKFHKKMTDMQKAQEARSVFTPAHSIQCLSEAIEWLFTPDFSKIGFGTVLAGKFEKA